MMGCTLRLLLASVCFPPHHAVFLHACMHAHMHADPLEEQFMPPSQAEKRRRLESEKLRMVCAIPVTLVD